MKMNYWKYLIGILLLSATAWGTIERGNLDIKGTLSVTGAQTFTGAPTFSALSASIVPQLSAGKVLQDSNISTTEFDFLNNVTSALCGINQSCTQTNKTFTAPTIDIVTLDGQASAPANPSAGFYKVYVKDSTGKPVILNSSGTESALGGGGGSSGINILSEYNPGGEDGTTYWSETGGGTLTTTSTAANVGNGLAGFSYDASANADYVESDARAIPSGLYGAYCLAETYYKGFDTSIKFQVTDGSNVLASRDLTAATGFQKLQLNFICPTSGNLTFRFTATGNAAIGYWDQVHLGSATNVQSEVIITSPESWTPTGTWSANTTYTGKKWRVGNMGFYEVKIALAGAPTSATLTVNMPSGEVIDTAALADSAETENTFSSNVQFFDNGTDFYHGHVTIGSTTSIVKPRVFGAAGSFANSAGVTQASPYTFASGDVIVMRWSAPIVGWQALTPSITSPANMPTRQVFLSGTAATYTTPAGVSHIRVRMVGGGGGGGGTGSASMTAGGNGTASTFGTALLSAGGGTGGPVGSGAGGAGGTSSLGTGPVGLALTGGPGTGGGATTGGSGANYIQSASGGSGCFGGGGGGGQANGAGLAGTTNTGGGGGGGGNGNTSGNNGAGGGSGGCIDALIIAPLATYTYTVGAAGTAGGAGTGGFAGGAGGTGLILVEEFYSARASIVLGNPTVQKFTSGSAQTYTRPQGVRYLKVKLFGGGGGSGGGSDQTGNGTAGGAGAATTWSGGSASAGGAAANANSNTGGVGGTATCGTATPCLAAVNGADGTSGLNGASSNAILTGGNGGNSPLGGAGGGRSGTTAGTAAKTNSGSGAGGGGGGVGTAAQGGYTGGGGGAGAYVEFIVNNPDTTYTYTVGAGGTAGNAGTNGGAGAAGAAGAIIVEEYYQ